MSPVRVGNSFKRSTVTGFTPELSSGTSVMAEGNQANLCVRPVDLSASHCSCTRLLPSRRGEHYSIPRSTLQPGSLAHDVYSHTASIPARRLHVRHMASANLDSRGLRHSAESEADSPRKVLLHSRRYTLPPVQATIPAAPQSDDVAPATFLFGPKSRADTDEQAAAETLSWKGVRIKRSPSPAKQQRPLLQVPGSLILCCIVTVSFLRLLLIGSLVTLRLGLVVLTVAPLSSVLGRQLPVGWSVLPAKSGARMLTLRGRGPTLQVTETLRVSGPPRHFHCFLFKVSTRALYLSRTFRVKASFARLLLIAMASILVVWEWSWRGAFFIEFPGALAQSDVSSVSAVNEILALGEKKTVFVGVKNPYPYDGQLIVTVDNGEVNGPAKARPASFDGRGSIDPAELTADDLSDLLKGDKAKQEKTNEVATDDEGAEDDSVSVDDPTVVSPASSSTQQQLRREQPAQRPLSSGATSNSLTPFSSFASSGSAFIGGRGQNGPFSGYPEFSGGQPGQAESSDTSSRSNPGNLRPQSAFAQPANARGWGGSWGTDWGVEAADTRALFPLNAAEPALPSRLILKMKEGNRARELDHKTREYQQQKWLDQGIVGVAAYGDSSAAAGVSVTVDDPHELETSLRSLFSLSEQQVSGSKHKVAKDRHSWVDSAASVTEKKENVLCKLQRDSIANASNKEVGEERLMYRRLQTAGSTDRARQRRPRAELRMRLLKPTKAFSSHAFPHSRASWAVGLSGQQERRLSEVSIYRVGRSRTGV